jgi:hypothetical protein
MDALQCRVAAESDTSFTIFDLSSLKKNLLSDFAVRITERLFLSCSGDRSYRSAKVYYEWMPLVLPEIEPWRWDNDIVRGQLRVGALQKQLKGLDSASTA